MIIKNNKPEARGKQSSLKYLKYLKIEIFMTNQQYEKNEVDVLKQNLLWIKFNFIICTK